MANTYLTRTNGTPTDARKWTVSFWFKLNILPTAQDIYFTGTSGTDEVLGFRIETDQTMASKEDAGGSTPWAFLVTRMLFRDTNAWYHIVQTFDSTLSTSSDRLKMWVNGIDLFATSGFTSTIYPSQNYEPILTKSGNVFNIGRRSYNNDNYFSGVISHFHLTDGYAYEASDFGETDATTGIWKIKTSPSVTYGNNGFFILKDGNSVTDQSGNGNNFTVGGGTLTNTEDNPSNVFATFNTLSGANTMAVNSTFSNGNTSVVNSGTVYNPYGTTLGVSSGKYYAEFKANANMGDGIIGIFAKLGTIAGDYLGSQTHQYSWYNASGGNIRNNSYDLVASVGTYTTNDIIGIALDCDNNKLYFHKNGTYISNGSGTGDPSSGTNGISITDPDDTDLGFYFMSAMDWGGSTRGNWSANFGNGYFGTTAVSSAGTNASGNGIFEYDVPTGYTALSTKGLNL